MCRGKLGWALALMEWDRYYRQMAQPRNLTLAWRRLETALNLEYKRFYRPLFSVYELTLEKNIALLSERLLSGVYQPKRATRIHLPKPSGLLRPMSLLHLEDLIVYQAITNVFLDKLHEKLVEQQRTTSFSNLVDRKNWRSIFLFAHWREGYRLFTRAVERSFKKGNTWVASFDLAAYYDTIDHSHLLSIFTPRNAYPQFCELTKRCLSLWTGSRILGHGIPQGPVASRLLGEIYLLEVDKALQGSGYYRYVDDIRLLGESEWAVQSKVVDLEMKCRELGLIPQGSKYALHKAETADEAVGSFVSLSPEEKEVLLNSGAETLRIFINAIESDPPDASTIRYILKSSGRNDELKEYVLGMVRRNPYLASEITQFLLAYHREPDVAKQIYEASIAISSPYDFVDGEYWWLLSKFSLSFGLRNTLKRLAFDQLKSHSNASSARMGALVFLGAHGEAGVIPWLARETDRLVQSIAISFFTNTLFENPRIVELAETAAKRSSFEPALSLAGQAYLRRTQLLPDANEALLAGEHLVVQNLYGIETNLDAVKVAVERLFGIKADCWTDLLGGNYSQVQMLLHLMATVWHVDKSAWVNYVDTFCDVATRSLVSRLASMNPGTAPSAVTRHGSNKDIGDLLDDIVQSRRSSKRLKRMAEGVQRIHARRRVTPTSHAFEKKTGSRTSIVSTSERNEVLGNFKEVLSALVDLSQGSH